jgi:Leucine rich repeat N-terminal domain
MTNLQRTLILAFSLHVLVAAAFDAEDCPGECHCTMDGLQMIVDCSGLELTELPTFPDNQA